MKYAADFRQIAREALSGKWMIAVLVGLVASLLGGAGADGGLQGGHRWPGAQAGHRGSGR